MHITKNDTMINNDLTQSTTPNPELALIDKSVFKPCSFRLTNIESEAESKEYLAYSFLLNEQNVKFRKAKITPTKIGQFVTLWKRNDKGITEPFDILDKFEHYIIVTRQNDNFGFFLFPKAVLYQHKILSNSAQQKDGKRGFRVYPSWNVTTSPQAQKTQLWQLNYFLDLSPNKAVDLEKAKRLFGHMA